MAVQVMEHLTLSDFDYDLPETLIAQEPADRRDASRLLVLDRETGEMDHRSFSQIASLFQPGDLLVVNNTRVFPCRLPATKRGGGRAEIFLLLEKDVNHWETLMKGTGGVGKRLTLPNGIEAEITAEGGSGTWLVRFSGVRDIRSVLNDMGRTPLPPYIRREPGSRDRERYQTVYAEREGAVAAPTAGLHFTGELLGELRGKQVEIVPITLHVGPGTFQPVRVDAVAAHRMHPERYEISDDTARRINEARAAGRRIIAVGTTSVRALETATGDDGRVSPGPGATSLFIYPGHVFRAVDALITNFHLPRSTLLMLVSAFAGRQRLLQAYRTAVDLRYRFYSYGDAMFISAQAVRKEQERGGL